MFITKKVNQRRILAAAANKPVDAAQIISDPSRVQPLDKIQALLNQSRDISTDRLFEAVERPRATATISFSIVEPSAVPPLHTRRE